MPKKHYSTFTEKVAWLLKHHKFLVGKENRKAIIAAMRRDKLVAPSTYWADVKLNEAIRQAKIRWFASHNR